MFIKVMGYNLDIKKTGLVINGIVSHFVMV